MKKFFILFLFPIIFLTSCGDTVDDIVNDLGDALLNFGEASAKIDGNVTNLNNFAGYRTSNNITSIYFSDIKFEVTNLDVKGEAILAFLHSDLVAEGTNVNISVDNALEIALNPKMAGVGALYLSNVSAKDLYELVTEYNKNQNIANVIAIAGQKDVDVKQVSILNFLEGYINFSFSKVADDKLSGSFSFKAFDDNGSVEITEGTFTDTPKDTITYE